jgi:hypothetical protein
MIIECWSKIQLSLFTQWSAYGKVEVSLHLLYLLGGEWSASRPGRFSPRETAPVTLLNRKLGVTQSRSESFGERKNLLPRLKIETRIFCYPASSIYTTLTELSRHPNSKQISMLYIITILRIEGCVFQVFFYVLYRHLFNRFRGYNGIATPRSTKANWNGHFRLVSDVSLEITLFASQ